MDYENFKHSTGRSDQAMQDTSLGAFRNKLESRSYSTDVDKTLATMIGYGKPLSRKMLSRLSGFEINLITQYVTQLIRDGKVQESKQKGKCKITRRLVYYLRVNPEYHAA